MRVRSKRLVISSEAEKSFLPPINDAHVKAEKHSTKTAFLHRDMCEQSLVTSHQSLAIRHSFATIVTPPMS